METKLLFALDIGTRSVIGLVAEQTGNSIRIIAAERQEHHTRAMLDGQIHDVPEVAHVLSEVKTKLEQVCGPLKKVSVAAAGRALCTIKSTSEIEAYGRGLLTADDERTLELAAIQTAQNQLATSGSLDDPTSYYCVGYSVVTFLLDDTPLKTLVGQRGKTAGCELIATFLPRQVIDSLQAAIQNVSLEIATLTLEPIAAINVLIPPTMRHLNLALVDVGAGTSDVAITKERSVVGYGMVPCAGDEITEAISQQYLLDFNVAEKVKRQLNGSKNKKVSFTDILGCAHKLPAKEIIHSMASEVAELAQAIAGQIIALNGAAPQAVLLVGGGALTTTLPEAVAQALDIPASRVAVRNPDGIPGVENIPAELIAPDAVTPLGILKLAGGQTLNFINVILNDEPLHLFNLGNLTVADALLAGGINVRSLQGRPGLGITISVNGKTKFIAGSHGQPGNIKVNDSSAAFTDRIQENDAITVTKGTDGASPASTVREVIDMPSPLPVVINGSSYKIEPVITINEQKAVADTKLADRDQLICRIPATLGEILAASGLTAKPFQYTFQVNGSERTYTVWPKYTVNKRPATPRTPVHAEAVISTLQPQLPSVGDILGLTATTDDCVVVNFNGAQCSVPTKRYTFAVNGSPAALNTIVPDGSNLEYSCIEQPNPMVSDVLLAAEFDPRILPPGTRVEINLNGSPAEYTALIKNNDDIDIIVGSSQPSEEKII